MVNNEELIVIGGLIDEKLTDSEFKIPVLGSIPLIGGIFRNKTQVMEKRNLIIFIKTTILDDQSQDNSNLKDISNTKYSQIEELLQNPKESLEIIPKISKPDIEDHIQYYQS